MAPHRAVWSQSITHGESRDPTRPRAKAGPAAWRRLLVLSSVLAFAAGCAEQATSPASENEPELRFPKVSVDAKLDTVESLQQDLDTPRHASDGGGRAWLASVEEAWATPEFETVPMSTSGEPRLRVGGRARFHLVYEAGPAGIAVGGYLFLQPPPFWEWDTPQTLYPDSPGYTEVSTDAEGVTLVAEVAGELLLGIAIEGRALAAGEQIRLVFGAGPAGTRVDRFAERRSRLWLAVDGDGDGVRSLVDDSPTVEIVAELAARLVLTLTTTAEPGQTISLVAAVLDPSGNAGVPYTGVVTLAVPEGLELPQRLLFGPADRGQLRVLGRALAPGIHRVGGSASDALEGLATTSNPLVVRAGIEPVRWADLHGHSNLSDGTGTPDDYFAYARDIAALDIVALTDHDHWGMKLIDAHPEMWEEIRAATLRAHQPGRFVTILGYEWTSWLQGHRHVLYFRDPNHPGNELFSSLDPRYENPAQLWQALEGRDALTFAHHSAGGPISTNWTFVPPPQMEPVTEITSVHGSSEASDTPGRIYNPVAGNFVRDVLDAGYRFGFIGSSDSHDGHPGLAHIAGGGLGGLAAIRTPELTRAAVLSALRARRTYATNGPRIYLELRLEGSRLDYEIAGTEVIERIDFIRTGLVASVEGDGSADPRGHREIPPLAPGEYVYLRAVQVDGGVVWSSPIFAD